MIKKRSIRKKYQAALFLGLLLLPLFPALTGCGSSLPEREGEKRFYTWSSGSLTVSINLDSPPAHMGEYQDFDLIIITAGTEPVIEFSDFTTGGFFLKEWRVISSRAREGSRTFEFRARLEPLHSGDLIIPPLRVLSGDAISEELISEALPVNVPSLLSVEESEAATGGQFPPLRPPIDEQPQKLSLVLWAAGILLAAGLIVLFVRLLKRRKESVLEPTPAEMAIYRTEDLNPADYAAFYTRAAEIIRGYRAATGVIEENLQEILSYYEEAAYTGRLSEQGRGMQNTTSPGQGHLTARSPEEDKAKMMVCFSKKEAV